jgi:hypothetical protein
MLAESSAAVAARKLSEDVGRQQRMLAGLAESPAMVIGRKLTQDITRPWMRGHGR